jgi:hypothetical protein
MEKSIKDILEQQLVLAHRATDVLRESFDRTNLIISKKELSIPERETCESFVARFSRLSDYLIQRVFRTVDEVELIFEGSIIDRLNRMEKRGIIASASDWREIRQLRNDISHEYLLEKAQKVVVDALRFAPLLLIATTKTQEYCKAKNII